MLAYPWVLRGRRPALDLPLSRPGLAIQQEKAVPFLPVQFTGKAHMLSEKRAERKVLYEAASWLTEAAVGTS